MASDIDPREANPLDLKRLTQARVMLGRFGAGLPTQASQAFLLDHARARQAVWSEVDWSALTNSLADLPLKLISVESQAQDRGVYVRRPDLGRRLSDASMQRLAGLQHGGDVVIIVGDGLSASAIDSNAAPLLRALTPRLGARRLKLAPIVLAAQARVALGDAVGEALGAKLSIMLIGERPGLSAADSVGAYLTYAPKSGTSDSRRNCISNIRSGGLSIDAAADAITALAMDMMTTATSGVGLKDALERLPAIDHSQPK